MSDERSRPPTHPLKAAEQAYLRALLAGDRLQAQRIVFESLEQDDASLYDIYLGVLQPSLYEIGRLWETGRLSIAQEHLATAITQSAQAALYSRVTLPSKLDRHAVVACLTGNYHDIGPRMLADFLQLAGYNARFLGANTPIDSLLGMIQDLKPEVIGLPATTPDQVESVRRAIEQIRTDFHGYRPTVMVGGLAFNLIDGLWKSVKADVWGPDARRALDHLLGTTAWR
jgi:methanogenic corrinoid protein MtbC1